MSGPAGAGSPEDRLDRLESLEAIRDLPRRYATAIEHRDVEAMSELFSPRATFGTFGTGPAGLRRLMGDTMATSIFAVILVANHTVTFSDPDAATGQVWARCYAQNDPGPFVEQLLRYDDTYERVDGRWLFTRRRHRMFFGIEAASPLDQAPARWPEHQVGVGDIPLADPLFASWHSKGREA